MGVDCYGWVEVQDSDRHIRGPRSSYGWSGIVRINDLVERNYSVFGCFFDVRNRFDTAIAGYRGLPEDHSQEVSNEVEEPNEIGAPSWILWSEIQASNWQDSVNLSPGWSFLFTLMEQLAAHYGDGRVRLVIWFDNSASL